VELVHGRNLAHHISARAGSKRRREPGVPWRHERQLGLGAHLGHVAPDNRGHAWTMADTPICQLTWTDSMDQAR
jgi:hypothetical protein